MSPSDWIYSFLALFGMQAPVMIAPLLIIFGLLLLLYGGEILVPATTNLAAYLGLSPALIAAIIVAGGTSAPELIVSIQAALTDNPSIALGNVIGSNIANICLVLGCGALIAPLSLLSPNARRDGYVMVGLTLFAICAFLLQATLSFGAAISLLLLSLIYIAYVIGRDNTPADMAVKKDGRLAILMTVLAIICLLLGAELVVRGGKDMAVYFGISDGVIALTVIAVGTSLPEITAVIASQLKGRTDIALGNILGSNIFNIGIILGISGMLHPLALGNGINDAILAYLAIATVVLMALIYAKMTIKKSLAIVFIGFYFLFLNQQF